MTKHTGNSFINLFNKCDCSCTMYWGMGWWLKKNAYALEPDSLGRATDC